MLTRLALFAWLVSLEALDAPHERQAALGTGRDLVALARQDRVAGDGPSASDDVLRLLAELEADGWVAWDWISFAGDLTADQPHPATFDDDSVQHVKNVRITPEGYAAYAARLRLGPSEDLAGDSRKARHPHDLFICHASEDKDDVARPLARAWTPVALTSGLTKKRLKSALAFEPRSKRG
jgi:hypothetical protein